MRALAAFAKRGATKHPIDWHQKARYHGTVLPTGHPFELHSMALEEAREDAQEMADDADAKTVTPWVRTVVSGVDIQRHPKYNKGLAFNIAERSNLYLRGLLPPAVLTQEVQVDRVMINVRSKSSDLERHEYLMGLQERNERLFFRVLHENTQELLPIIGLPAVGAFCELYGLMFRAAPRGLYISLKDKGSVYDLLKNWPERRVKAICLTDGERVGALGDLGINAIGCAIGKLALYTACAGIPPSLCLPVCIDVGTDNEELLNSPFYVGTKQRRVRGEEYCDLLEETLEAIARRFGSAVFIHAQDMTYQSCSSFLQQYRGTFPVFSDDIQGTAAVVMAGIMAAQKLTGRRLSEHVLLFAGEGRGATVIAEVVATAIARETNQTVVEARQNIWLVDSEGLVTRDRANTIDEHKLLWCHDVPPASDVLASIRAVKPTVFLDIASMGNCLPLGQEACSALAACTDRPMVFALSEPGVLTPDDAFKWTEGRAIFTDARYQRAHDERFTLPDGRRVRANVAQPACIVPGIALGAIMSRSTRVRDEMIIAAAQALAGQVTDDIRAEGGIYPDMGDMRKTSAIVAKAVAARAYEAGVAVELPRPRDLLTWAEELQYQPRYKVYR